MSCSTLLSSVPAWVNAVTVVVLAVITWRYARSAKRQAAASEQQAKAATKQAAAAERQISILQSQIEQQAGFALATLKECISELQQTANDWAQRMILWGQLTPQAGISILPDGWAVSLEHARCMAPDLYQELLTIQRLSKQASRSIDEFTTKAAAYRGASEPDQIQVLLVQIQNGCEAAAKRLAPLS